MMKRTLSGTSGIAALLLAVSASAQGERPQPLPELPTIPSAQPAQPVVSSGAPVAPTAIAAPSAAPQTPPPPAAPRGRPPAHADAPLPPPAPGIAPPPPAAVVGPVFAGDAAPLAIKDPPLAGWHGSFFLRDSNDYVRLYPRGRLNLDFNTWPGAPSLGASDGGLGLEPRFFLQSLRLEIAGQLFQRWSFHMGVDFGGQPVSGASGGAGQTAAAPGSQPTGATARYSPVETASATPAPTDVFVNYAVCNCLNFMVGQYDVAFSMENQTNDNTLSFMERSIGIAGLAAPSKKELGLTIWGELLDARLAYAFEVMVGDGQNRPQVDSFADFAGRVFTRPLLGTKSALEKLQVGVSARTGKRDPGFVGYDYSPVATTQGYALWAPTYVDAQGRTVHVIPSGSQSAIGGEFRLPVAIVELRGEAYYVANDTREAIDGYQLTNTERLGQMSGVGWYVQASAWPLGDSFVNGDPGLLRPTVVDLNKEVGRPRRGLEVLARVSGVNADYQGNSRGGAADTGTATADTGSRIDVFQYSLGLNYWYTRNLRVAVNYSAYHTPGSGSVDNRAAVPANVIKAPDLQEHLLHELGTRVSVWF